MQTLTFSNSPMANSFFSSSLPSSSSSSSSSTVQNIHRQRQHQLQQNQLQNQQQQQYQQSRVEYESTKPDPAIVPHLLNQAYSLPCSAAAQTFMQLVQPIARFQLALDVLLPLLVQEQNPVDLPKRILVSYILHYLYKPYPMSINPFRSVLLASFISERKKAAVISEETGGPAANEQLVWVLWKILKEDGNDIGPYSPNTLARSPLPTELRANNLILDQALYNRYANLNDYSYTYYQSPSQEGASTTTNTTTRTYSASSEYKYNNNNAAIPMTFTQNSRPSSREQTYSTEDDQHNDSLIYAMELLLAARERVLNLSEQRHVAPHIPELASSGFITSIDLASIISFNTSLAYTLFHNLIVAHEHQHRPANSATSSNEGRNSASPTATHDTSLHSFLDILPSLPPTLPTFDLLGRLLRDSAPTTSEGQMSIGQLVKEEVLGRFLHEAVGWVERAEVEEREGRVSDDRFAKGVSDLCRFYTSLVKWKLVDPASDVDSAEMAAFSLRYARFGEANALYRILAMGKF